MFKMKGVIVMDKYIVMGYEFASKEEAEAAKKDADKIAQINLQGNMKNHKIALSVYNKCVTQNIFQTQIGFEYLRSIQRELLEAPDIINEQVKPMPVRNDGIRNISAFDEKKEEIRKRGIDIHNNRMMEKELQTAKDRYVRSMIVNAVLVVIIIAMVLLVKFGERFDVDAYKESIENDYLAWEKSLQERESSLDERTSQSPEETAAQSETKTPGNN